MRLSRKFNKEITLPKLKIVGSEKASSKETEVS